jgi:hypothetical protein
MTKRLYMQGYSAVNARRQQRAKHREARRKSQTSHRLKALIFPALAREIRQRVGYDIVYGEGAYERAYAAGQLDTAEVDTLPLPIAPAKKGCLGNFLRGYHARHLSR